VFLAIFFDRGPILFATVVTGLIWIYFFVDPYYSIEGSGPAGEIRFVVYIVATLAVSEVTIRLRTQWLAERERKEQASTLYRLSRELAAGAGRADILTKAVNLIGTAFQADVFLMLPDPERQGRLALSPASTWQPDETVRARTDWAFERNSLATASHPNEPFNGTEVIMPLSAGGPPVGVFGVRSRSGVPIDSKQRDLLERLNREVTLILERQRLRDVEMTNKLLSESERLGRTLLRSVSHELRTPIAAIGSAASSLGASGVLTPEQQSLTAEIQFASARLNRVVQSLLSAARLQSGQIKPRLDWCDVSELLTSALHSISKLTVNHRLETHIESNLPLVMADFVLMEQSLANLVVNAAMYCPKGTPIEIGARIENRNLLLEVSDRGPGLPDGELEKVFEPFHRASNAPPGGTGLGLAIVKGFVEAHGGHVQAANRPAGGAIFTICLPATETPNLPEEIT